MVQVERFLTTKAGRAAVVMISYYCCMRSIEHIAIESADKRNAAIRKIAFHSVYILVASSAIATILGVANIELKDDATSNLLFPLATVSGTMLAVFIVALIRLVDTHQSIEERVTKFVREESTQIFDLITASRPDFLNWYQGDSSKFFILLAEFAGPENLNDLPRFFEWRQRIVDAHESSNWVNGMRELLADGLITPQEFRAQLTQPTIDFHSAIVPRIHQIDIELRQAEWGRRNLELAREGRFVAFWLAVATITSIGAGFGSLLISPSGIPDELNPLFVSIAVIATVLASAFVVKVIWQLVLTVDEYIDRITIQLWKAH